MPKQNILIEVCCDHLESATVACESGANRIELCAALELGGLTPSLLTTATIMESYETPIMVLIRPRPGHFIYSQKEKHLILNEIEAFQNLGVEGFVFGALNEQHEIDLEFMKEIMDTVEGFDFTFHRAFDCIQDHIKAAVQLIDIGCKRLLSSGKAREAIQGIQVLNELNELYSDHLTIMPGSGILSSNVEILIEKLEPTEIHLSAKSNVTDTNPDSPFELSHYLTDKEELLKVQKLLK